ncbi:hypothetical protein ILYODFUR_000999 [Ilyodon furcidens]|uniref:Uncharacterized protein n=1 Tax=Ilyodon furcidens TaxID=33524 RepID=A0ABV0UN76_9TELE
MDSYTDREKGGEEGKTDKNVKIPGGSEKATELLSEDRRLKKMRGIQSHFDVCDVMEKRKKNLRCAPLADGSEDFFESCSAPGGDGSSRSVMNAENHSSKLSKLQVSILSDTTILSWIWL